MPARGLHLLSPSRSTGPAGSKGLLLRPFILLALFLGLLFPSPTHAQGEFSTPVVDYKFGDTLSIRVRILSEIPVTEAVVLFNSEGDSHTETGQMTVSADNEASFIYDLKARPLRAFSKISYHFLVTLKNEEVKHSSSYSFTYEDNRFKWQSIEESHFRANWYSESGDLAMAQSVLDAAQAGLRQIQSFLRLPEVQDWINIYVYASSQDMQTTLDASTQNRVAGHADPDLGIMVVVLPTGPDQHLLMEQRIPHELMHILLYRQIGPSYSNLPTWLNEGLASVAELYPNTDYQILLSDAYQKGTLLNFSSLCKGFPRDASNALLAYAQSASFVQFLHKSFGSSGIEALVNAYGNGLDCNHGALEALNLSLPQLERQWRQDTFAENLAWTALLNFLPWIVLLVIILAGPLALALVMLRRKSAGENATSQAASRS